MPSRLEAELKQTKPFLLSVAADLVALDADPLADVRHFQRVRWVMKGGVVAPR